MKVLKKIGIGLLMLVALLVIIGFFLPSIVKVNRSIEIKASQELVFSQFNVLKEFRQWSPWDKIDPNMTVEYSGPESGKGCSYTWKSEHENVGNGIMTIRESYPSDSIFTEMDFMENGKASSKTTFVMKGDLISVTWGFETDMGFNPFGRIFGLFMDKMIGADFEQGLKNLKERCENYKGTLESASSYTIKDTLLTNMHVLLVSDSGNTSDEISQKFGAAYGEIQAQAGKSKVEIVGAPFSVTKSYEGGTYVFDAGMPVSGAVAKTEGRVQYKLMPAGKAVMAVYTGAYEKTELAYAALDKYMQEKGMKQTGYPWEVFITDPMTEKDTAKWITHIFYSVE